LSYPFNARGNFDPGFEARQYEAPSLIGKKCQIQIGAKFVKITPLSAVGAEVTEVDVKGLTDAQDAQLKAAFAQHGLLIFRDQDLVETDHVDLAERWGQINTNRFFKAHADHPQIALVDKAPDQIQNIGGDWHTDHSYDQVPALGSILVARTLPETGGDTWFASMYRAFDQLSDGLKTLLLTLNAVHSAKHVFGNKSEYMQTNISQKRMSRPDLADALPDPIHPVVVRHPLSGRPVLYVNPGFTIRFEGWTQEESAPLLNYLYQSAVVEDQVEVVDWRTGTIAFWDNRATWHFAQNDYPGQARRMHRITIEGEALQAHQ
jgi:taurine dioxygenase